MKYKALFLDVDGTTVVHHVDSLPSSKVTDAIAACRKLGIHVGLATSRPLHAVKKVIEHLELTDFCVISSGSQIYDPVKKVIQSQRLLPLSVVAAVIALAKKYERQLWVYNGQQNTILDEAHIPDELLGMYFPELEPSVLASIAHELSSISEISTHRMEAWKPEFECLDILSAEASKLHGVIDVCKLLSIDTKEAIGVGDGYNDFPLLLACGLKIAMGNAVPELKAVADFVAPTVEEDGVAMVIEKFILNA
jgi:Cof subfamily protein (haloacid dehalogenase superfamily)